MHDVTRLCERHVKVMENLERQQRLSAEQRRKEEQRWDQAYLRMRENLLGESEVRESLVGGFLRMLLPLPLGRMTARRRS